MPTYQYRCKSCGHEFEEFQSMSEETLTLCPACGTHALVRVISGAGLVFKGSGFYLTDYKNRSGGGGKTTPAPASSGSDAPAGDAAPTGDTKPKGGKESPGKESSSSAKKKGGDSTGGAG